MTTLLLCAISMMARPAHKAANKVQQPDGTYVTIRLHGDEWRSFNTTDDGYSVVKDDRGYYVYAELKDGQLKATAQVAHDLAERSASEQAFLADVKKYQVPEMTAQMAEMKSLVQQAQQQTLRSRRATNYNNFKGLLILVEFNDRSFSREDYKDILSEMVNKEGYTGYDNQNYTGSVRDYYYDNSLGKFAPQFDVVGPYKVNYSQYDPNGTSNTKAILTAVIDAADPDVNFADYDCDGDGYVDLVFFMMAGYSSSYSGNDSRLWWPHRSMLYSGWSYPKKDGVYLRDYASSTEMYGWESRPSGFNNCIDGIGTICHEFSHVLGLPDFYDTDYANSGGESNHPGEWSVMAGGSDYNRGRTPVGYSLYERYAVGFADEPEKIEAEGSYQLDALYKEGKGYRIDTPVSDEFFLLENRQKNDFKWDAYLPGSGMLVHRVERPGSYIWTNNIVNCDPSHNYYEVVRANGTSSSSASSRDLFPSNNKTALHNNTSPANLKTWNGTNTKWGLTNIKLSNKMISFDVTNTFELKSLSLPATLSLGVGLVSQIEATVNPDYAEYTLTWSSSNKKVATVDQDGNVKGVAVGKATITAKSNNGLTASCEVTVEELNSVDVDAFKQLTEGTKTLLQLQNAEVLYVNDNTAYVRDAKGCLIFSDMELDLKKNDRINGTVIAQSGNDNNVPMAVGVKGSTNASGLTIVAGAEVQPREVKLEDLTEADYADYVLVKGVQVLKGSDGAAWATSGEKKARVWGAKLKVSGVTIDKDFDQKYYDIEAIYGTDVYKEVFFEALHLMKSPVEVAAPTAISVLSTDSKEANGMLYNIHGQRVSNNYRGLIIRNGKKMINK